jgi:hypothetical protein
VEQQKEKAMMTVKSQKKLQTENNQETSGSDLV